MSCAILFFWDDSDVREPTAPAGIIPAPNVEKIISRLQEFPNVGKTQEIKSIYKAPVWFILPLCRFKYGRRVITS